MKSPRRLRGLFLGVTDKFLVTVEEDHLQNEKCNEGGPDIGAVMAYYPTLISVGVIKKKEERYKKETK